MSGSYRYHIAASKPSYRLDVVYEVHERGVCPERLKDLSLVEEGVDQVRVVMEAVGQTRVHYLQHHLQYLLHYLLLRCLDTRRACDCHVTDKPTPEQLLSYVYHSTYIVHVPLNTINSC